MSERERRAFLRAATLTGLAGAAGWQDLASARDLAPSPPDPRGRPPDPRARVLDREALEDILVGCAYLGCGGGGTLAEGTQRLADDIKSNLPFALLAVADLRDQEWVASPYGLGSNAPPTETEKKRFARVPRSGEDAVEASFRLLAKFLNRSFVATIPGELGPWSTAAALLTAARLGIPALDADRVGRASPEATHDSVMVAGLSTVPLAAVTGFGDALILEHAATGSRI